MIKAVAILAFVAAAQAISTGNPYLNPHIGVQGEQTVRGYGGLNTVSHQSKSVVSPHSSVQKTDTRVTNDALTAYASPLAHGYAAPAYAAHGYAAPALAHGYAGHGYAAPAIAAHGYAAPALAAHGYAAPAIAAHGYAAPALAHGYAGHGYAAPAIAAHGYAAPAIAAHGYAAPALAHGYAAPVAKAGLLGTAYSAVVPGVASHTFSRTIQGYGNLAYGY
ncbi:unnamed protein product [Allacma fusca]|uniref:Uncharacterized protein n=1 Tax=Allacma fusca TaxID=39272 RepID=A0A8J2LRX5_9HEXA|nr:unnamed protein product [Allacma fusca]